jgi:hypothetical protein
VHVVTDFSFRPTEEKNRYFLAWTSLFEFLKLASVAAHAVRIVDDSAVFSMPQWLIFQFYAAV